jgi:hypothetical protein
MWRKLQMQETPETGNRMLLESDARLLRLFQGSFSTLMTSQGVDQLSIDPVHCLLACLLAYFLSNMAFPLDLSPPSQLHTRHQVQKGG